MGVISIILNKKKQRNNFLNEGHPPRRGLGPSSENHFSPRNLIKIGRRTKCCQKDPHIWAKSIKMFNWKYQGHFQDPLNLLRSDKLKSNVRSETFFAYHLHMNYLRNLLPSGQDLLHLSRRRIRISKILKKSPNR